MNVERTVKVMPLWKLQTVGSEQLDFLYENVGTGGLIRLRPGVAYCLRAFYPMIIDMIQGGWLHFVQRCNPGLLGQVTDLRSFLFGAPRTSLETYRPLFRDLQEGRCFYCERAIHEGWSYRPLHPLATIPAGPGPQLRLDPPGV